MRHDTLITPCLTKPNAESTYTVLAPASARPAIPGRRAALLVRIHVVRNGEEEEEEEEEEDEDEEEEEAFDYLSISD